MKTHVLLLGVLMFPSASPGAAITVDLTGGGDFTEVQPAIDAANDGDEVVVRPGEYVIVEPIDFNRLHDPENPASPPVKNLVLRSEAGAEETIIRMAEEPADPDRASVVIFESGETEGSVLEGFTLTGGGGIDAVGGGVYCYKSSPTLTSCTIAGNSGGQGGGVFCNVGAAATLTGCTISGNSAGSWGGGASCKSNAEGGAFATLTGCTISGNSARLGGGVFSVDSSLSLTHCTISGNSANGRFPCDGGGGGMYVRGSHESSATLRSCIVWDNAGGSVIDDGFPALDVAFCCIEGDEEWEGQIGDVDPSIPAPGSSVNLSKGPEG